MNSHGGNVRAEAVRLLIEVLPAAGERGGKSLSDVLPPARERSCDPTLLQEIAYGVCRFHSELSWLVNRRLQRPFKPEDRDIELLLMIGLFQLTHTRIPDHASIAETVAAARLLRKEWATGVTNAVLRRLQREREGLADEIASAGDAVRWSHPQWLVDMIAADWPNERAAIFAANNTRPPFCLRVNTRQGTRDEYLARLREDEMEAEPTALSPDGIRLVQAVDVHTLPGFMSGAVSVQDEAAQLCGYLFPTLAPGARVLDACAAPGSKTAHLAERFPDAQILALDIDDRRARRITDNLERLRLTATVQAADARKDDWWDGVPFDAILVDAPCSATGVLRRHPDGKWLRQKGDIGRLAHRQRALLDALWPKLRVGGTLVYATCSVLREENEHVIAGFLAAHADAEADAVPAEWGVPCGVGRQLLPSEHGPDGFFLCRLQRKG